MNRALNTLISSAVELGYRKARIDEGKQNPEISQRHAAALYGKWFTDAIRNGRLRPCRIEDGHAGTRWYNVQTILELKIIESADATLTLKNPL